MSVVDYDAGGGGYADSCDWSDVGAGGFEDDYGDLSAGDGAAHGGGAGQGQRLLPCRFEEMGQWLGVAFFIVDWFHGLEQECGGFGCILEFFGEHLEGV